MGYYQQRVGDELRRQRDHRQYDDRRRATKINGRIAMFDRSPQSSVLRMEHIVVGHSAMTRVASLLTLLATALVCLLPATPALAQRARVFVASYGSDSNPCTFGSPCKTFQNAVNVVAVGGEVTAIDSAGFGTFTISQPVTITSPNGVEAGIAAPASGGAAITITATSGVVSLNGLTLDGDNVSGTTGILFTGSGVLHVQNCVIRNFGSDGIAFEPTGSTSNQFTVSNTIVSDNGLSSSGYGIYIVPNASSSGSTLSVLNHVNMENNETGGLLVEGNVPTVIVTDSVSANNGFGIEVNSFSTTPIKLIVRNSTIANNTTDGLLADNDGATIRVTRSSITGNGTGWSAGDSSTLSTFSTNSISGNVLVNTSPTTKSTED
jgi:hypothetical protein